VSESRPVARRHSRRLALQVLYAADLARQSANPDAKFDIDATFEDVATHFDLPSGARAFAQDLVSGVDRSQEQIDSQITVHARNWRLDRMATVDRNVLRLAVYELRADETPHTVVINEAIELARDFGSERSPAFVNGVLDAVAREMSDARPPERSD
jgi:N utilization substance protein B